MMSVVIVSMVELLFCDVKTSEVVSTETVVSWLLVVRALLVATGVVVVANEVDVAKSPVVVVTSSALLVVVIATGFSVVVCAGLLDCDVIEEVVVNTDFD